MTNCLWAVESSCAGPPEPPGSLCCWSRVSEAWKHQRSAKGAKSSQGPGVRAHPCFSSSPLSLALLPLLPPGFCKVPSDPNSGILGSFLSRANNICCLNLVLWSDLNPAVQCSPAQELSLGLRFPASQYFWGDTALFSTGNVTKVSNPSSRRFQSTIPSLHTKIWPCWKTSLGFLSLHLSLIYSCWIFLSPTKPPFLLDRIPMLSFNTINSA